MELKSYQFFTPEIFAILFQVDIAKAKELYFSFVDNFITYVTNSLNKKLKLLGQSELDFEKSDMQEIYKRIEELKKKNILDNTFSIEIERYFKILVNRTFELSDSYSKGVGRKKFNEYFAEMDAILNKYSA